ncbi:MAG: crtI, partial [Phycisphaerales bacterium]|nr:crtI [Phycisphaerales bacterium]
MGGPAGGPFAPIIGGMAKAIVIGAGFGGIAAALRLRKKGYDVTIIDKQDKLGGRAYQYERHTPHGTFIHDAGPTVITAKFLFDELFELFGKKREDYVEFRDIYPWYRIVFAGAVTKRDAANVASSVAATPASPRAGTSRMHAPVDDRTGPMQGDAGVAATGQTSPAELPFFDYGGTLEQFEAQIAKFEPKDVAGFRKFLAHSKKIFDVGFTQLGDQPFDQFTTMLKCAPALLRLQNYKTVYGTASKYITNESLRRVFSFQPLLVGGNPFNTTSIYSLIFYLERQWGVQFAMGGTGAIVRGLERLMREEGIEIRLGEEVEKINIDATEMISWQGIDEKTGKETGGAEIKSPRISGVSVRSVPQFGTPNRVVRTEATTWNTKPWQPTCDDIEQRGTDLVVCNADTPYAYEELIDPEYRKGLAPRRLNRKSQITNLKFSMGLFVLYFGTTRPYPGVAHHTI